MQVGLDHIPLVQLFDWDTVAFMEHAAAYGYEGVLLPGRPLTDPARLEQVLELEERLGLYVELGGAGIDAALSGRSPEELAEPWPPLFEAARQVGSKVLVTGLGTWPWEGRTQTDPSRSVEAQIEGGIATLMRLKPLAEEYQIAVAIHTAFFTADEYVRIMQAVDSPCVGLCLDTGNAFLVLEDPVKFAAKVAPWVKGTHLKDSCIYLTDGGMHWLGGAPLGRGSVDLPAIIEWIAQANPEVNLSVEDHWGRSTVPVFDANFLESLPHWRGESVAGLLRHLHHGGELIRGGALPTLEESQHIDWKRTFPERARYNAIYVKQIRDRLEGM